MESKLYEECHEGGGFMAEQAMLKQDETVRTQIRRQEMVGLNAHFPYVFCDLAY